MLIVGSISESSSVMSDSLRPHELNSPWNSPGQNTGVGSLSLLQEIFPTQGSTQVPCTSSRFFTIWAKREAHRMCWEMFYALLYSGRDCIVGLYCWYCFKRLSEEIEIAGSLKKLSSRKTSTSVLLTLPKTLTVWIITNCGKFFKRWEYQTTWPASWEICMQVKKQQLELDMERQIGFNLGREDVKTVYCHPAHLSNLYVEHTMQNESALHIRWPKYFQ